MGHGSHLPVLATPKNCSGRTFIVTGANTGLGFDAAQHLVAQGAARVVLAVRNIDAGEKAKATIEAATNKRGVAEVWQLDLESYKSVKAFAEKASSGLDRIDALIENAGVSISKPREAEGHLSVVTVNVLSTFLLAVLLLPKLHQTARKYNISPVLTIVASSMPFMNGAKSQAEWDKVKEDPIAKLDTWQGDVSETYPLSKAMDIVVARQLAALIPLSKTGVIINTLCPGLCVTELGRNLPPEAREGLKPLYEQFGRTSEEGSRVLLYGAFAGKESHGAYLDSCEIAEDKLPGWLKDESTRRTWDVVSAELEAVEPGCVKRALELAA